MLYNPDNTEICSIRMPHSPSASTTVAPHLTHPKYRTDIDGLRAIAILAVVGFHAFPTWIKGGFIGVDVFFVISGFLISTIIFGSLNRDAFSFAEFYARRIKRIFPALVLVLIASFAFGWFSLLADEYKQLGKHIAGGAGFVANFVLWGESGYFDNAAETKPLLHLWSLGIEEQFYFVWPLLLWLAWKKRFNLLTIALLVAAVSFGLNIATVRNDSVAAFYSPQTRFWELMVGSVLAYVMLYKHEALVPIKQRLDKWLCAVTYAHASGPRGDTLRDFQALLGAALIAIGIAVVAREKQFPGWWALLPTLGAVLIIGAGTHAWFNRAVLSNRVLVWFGLISYPLYLWHWPLLSFARLVEGGLPSRDVRMAMVALSIVLAWLTYKLIEKPFRFGNHSRTKTFALVAMMTIIGSIGFNCYKREGLGFRFQNIVQELTHFHVDIAAEWREGSCFLNPNQEFSAFDTCDPQSRGDDKPSIVIWGDSHAAHLYPGYKDSFGEKFRIVQRTANLCPPILGMEIGNRPNCRNINNSIFNYVKQEKPNRVVLASMWTLWDWKQVESTIERLKEIGVPNIDLIGPVPQWMDGLPKQMFVMYKTNSDHAIPYRTKQGLNPNFIQVDSAMANFARQLGANYISPMRIFCDESGCLTRLGETGDSITSYDSSGHLTPRGAKFLVAQFPRS